MKKLSGQSILITGGTGFIGSNLVRYFLKRGYNIELIVRKSSDLSRIRDLRRLLRIHQLNLSDTKELKKLIETVKPSYIFHLSSYGNSYTQTNIKKIIQTNINSFYSLLHASKDIPYIKFINAGSSSEYGTKNRPMIENEIALPETFYGLTKESATLLGRVFAKKYHKPIITFRFFSVYGPYEANSRFIPTAIKNALSDKPILLTPGKVRRDFIYIGDILDAYEKAMSQKTDLGGIYNLGTGIQHTNDEVITTLSDILKKDIKIKKGAYPKRSFDTSNWVADISKTSSVLNWTPRYSLLKGLKKTVTWHKNNEKKHF